MKTEQQDSKLIGVGQQSYSREYYNQADQAIRMAGSTLSNEERWLLQCPPHYTQFQAPATQWQGMDFAIEYGGKIAFVHEQERKAHTGTLHMLYKVLTKLHGITVTHNPNGLIRDSKLLSRRLLLTQQVEARLQQIQERDRPALGRKFKVVNGNNRVFVITEISKSNSLLLDGYEDVFWEQLGYPGSGELRRSIGFFREMITTHTWKYVI